MAKPKAEERVLCLEETSGKLLWSHRYSVDYPEWIFGPSGDGPRATPIVQGGKLYTLGALGHLFCLDAVAGTVVWEKNLAAEYQVEEFTGITASPLIEGDLLILYMCGEPEACIVAFDKNSGEEVWQALDDAFSYSSPIIVTSGGERQFIVWTQDVVTSLQPTTGKILWREPFHTPGDQTVSTPVFQNNRLLIGGLMFHLETDRPAAKILWPAIQPASKRVLSDTSTAMLQGDHVYSGTLSGSLVCLEAGTGKQVWEALNVTASGHGASIHLTPNGDSVLIFTDEGNLIRARLTPRGYEELSRVHVLDPTYPFFGRQVTWPPPAYANHCVFARNSAELVCASLASPP